MSEIDERLVGDAWNAISDGPNKWDCLSLDERGTYVSLVTAYEAAKPAPSPSGEMVERLHWRERVLEDGSRTEETITRTREALREAIAHIGALEALVSQQAGELERVKGERDVALANHASCTILWEQDRGRAEAALAKAVEAEREACAKVADEHAEAWGLAQSTPAIVIAAAIRSRAQESETGAIRKGSGE